MKRRLFLQSALVVSTLLVVALVGGSVLGIHEIAGTDMHFDTNSGKSRTRHFLFGIVTKESTQTNTVSAIAYAIDPGRVEQWLLVSRSVPFRGDTWTKRSTLFVGATRDLSLLLESGSASESEKADLVADYLSRIDPINPDSVQAWVAGLLDQY